jgi:hypothetical protein
MEKRGRHTMRLILLRPECLRLDQAGGRASHRTGGRIYLILRTVGYTVRARQLFAERIEMGAEEPANEKLCRIKSVARPGRGFWPEISAQATIAGGKDRSGWLAERSGIYHLGGPVTRADMNGRKPSWRLIHELTSRL